MDFSLVIPDDLVKCFKKLAKRDKKQLEAVNKKIQQILADPYHFKPLRGDKKGSRRVHIDSSFVLIYEIDEKTIKLLDYEHHDAVYE